MSSERTKHAHPPSSPTSSSALGKVEKKTRTEVEVPSRVTSALDIKEAISIVATLPALGFCPTYGNVFKDDHELEQPDENQPKGEEFVIRNKANECTLEDLRKVYDDFPVPMASGSLKTFNLRVTRPGCEYDGPVTMGYSQWAFEKMLPDWLKNAVVSGFGDVRTQETKVDTNVRNACEIPPEEFHIDQDLLTQIQTKWAAHFIPRKVRAVPYKIHLYGPGGHFKPHRDTPEKDLVGTFLVGIYDDSGSGHFCIGKEKFKTRACSWVAFHPDVPHSVSRLSSNQYRAVIAFKIFRDNENDNDNDSVASGVQDRCNGVLEKMQPPYGIFMDRQYCMGTSKLSGFDLVLLASAQSRLDTRVYTLPVVTEFHSYSSYDECGPSDYSFSTKVYPFTEAHVDYLLDGDITKAGEPTGWLEGVAGVPFYSVALKKTAVTWASESEEGAEYTGNESRPATEDSIYLSYAMLVLPNSPIGGNGGERVD